MFTKKEKKTICSECRRIIKPKEKYTVIRNKVYCEKCAKKKKDWDFMFLMDLLEDD